MYKVTAKQEQILKLTGNFMSEKLKNDNLQNVDIIKDKMYEIRERLLQNQNIQSHIRENNGLTYEDRFALNENIEAKESEIRRLEESMSNYRNNVDRDQIKKQIFYARQELLDMKKGMK
jgi:chromosome segregation ATPase